MKIYLTNINFTKIIFLFLIGNYNFYSSQQQEHSINYEIQYDNILNLFIGKFNKIKEFFDNQNNIDQWKSKVSQENINDFLKNNSSFMILSIGKKLYSIEKLLKNSYGYCDLQFSSQIDDNIDFLNMLRDRKIINYFTDRDQKFPYLTPATINEFCDIVINIINEIKKKKINNQVPLFYNENIDILNRMNGKINSFLKDLDIQVGNDSYFFIISKDQHNINGPVNNNEDIYPQSIQKIHKDDQSKGSFSNHIGWIFIAIGIIIIIGACVYFYLNSNNHNKNMDLQNENSIENMYQEE